MCLFIKERSFASGSKHKWLWCVLFMADSLHGWFLVLWFLHSVQGEFPDIVSGASHTVQKPQNQISIFIPCWKSKIKFAEYFWFDFNWLNLYPWFSEHQLCWGMFGSCQVRFLKHFVCSIIQLQSWQSVSWESQSDIFFLSCRGFIFYLYNVGTDTWCIMFAIKCI